MRFCGLRAFTQFTAMGYGLYLLWTRAITFGTLTLFAAAQQPDKCV